MAWQPLFSGRATEPYARAIDAIVKRIDAFAVRDTDWGRPLLHAYLACARSSDEHRARSESLVDRAIELLDRGTRGPSLYGGVAGVGWLAAHTDALFGRRDEEAYEEVDRALLNACAPPPRRPVYDLIEGPVGVGVYFLERLPHATTADALTRILDALEARAERPDGQLTWFTPAALLPRHQLEFAPNGYYNLGVAHGVPGIVGFLAEACRAGVSMARARTLLEPTIRWVLAQRLPDGLFPSWCAPNLEPHPSRLAWCYGELGVSVMLLSGGRALGDRCIEREAIDVALAAAARRADTGVFDACLCHGAAGNGHLFNRLFQATGRADLRDASCFWFDRALALRVEGAGVAGYRAWKPMERDTPAEHAWEDDTSFLTGASGIALAFLAAISPVEPNWDRVLLARLDPIAGE